jgi:hypothetical protein
MAKPKSNKTKSRLEGRTTILRFSSDDKDPVGIFTIKKTMYDHRADQERIIGRRKIMGTRDLVKNYIETHCVNGSRELEWKWDHATYRSTQDPNRKSWEVTYRMVRDLTKSGYTRALPLTD